MSKHPFFAAWALPFLALGAALSRRKAPQLLLWALLGLAPAVTIAAAAEPNRILAAWPALCMLCGLGCAWAIGRIGVLALAVLLLLGAGWELKAFQRSMDENYGRWYSESANVMRLGSRYPGRRLANELGETLAASARFAWGPRPAGAAPLFLVPYEYVPGLGKDAGLLKPEGQLEDPPQALAARLGTIEAEINGIRRGLPFFGFRRRRDRFAAFLASGQGDPWTRTAALEGALQASASLGELEPALLKAALSEPLCSSSSLLWLAQKAGESGDAAFARRLCARALQIDPRRPCP